MNETHILIHNETGEFFCGFFELCYSIYFILAQATAYIQTDSYGGRLWAALPEFPSGLTLRQRATWWQRAQPVAAARRD
jgi:hypothetical protein